jgi:arylformamidase
MKRIAFLAIARTHVRGSLLTFAFTFAFATLASAQSAETKADIPYVENGHARQVLDIHAPVDAKGKSLPVLFWIHGGGWQTGDKKSLDAKLRYFNEKGFVLVSTNYRLLPDVKMEDIISDIAKSLAWTHKNIAEHGGDPQRIFVAGHSAGAQLAALICIDDRYLKAEGMPFTALRGCIPVDGDTYDVPAIIETAETRRRVHGMPPIQNGHRMKFGNDVVKHKNFSAVTHVSKGRNIPPFLILYVANHPDNAAQAQRLSAVLKEHGIPVKAFGGKDTDHVKLNKTLGMEGDPGTAEVEGFVGAALGKGSLRER